MVFEIARRFKCLQNLVIEFAASLHPSIMHNLAKIEMLKKALWQCELEGIEGGYFEFGVFEGSSLLAAIKSHRKMKSRIPRYFYGFDSFDEGFKYTDARDKHPFFREGQFATSYRKVKKRLSKYSNVTLVKGYFEDTIAGRDAREFCHSDRCAVMFVDCDLMHPTLIALNFMKSLLQQGSIIVLDDYFAYRGDESRGTCGGMRQFLAEHGSISVREFHPYGYGGMSFIVTKVEEQPKVPAPMLETLAK